MTSPDTVVAGLLEAQRSLTVPSQWQLRPATITIGGTGAVVGRFDGEGFDGTVSSDVPMTSLIGTLAPGGRVMVMTVPPLGNYAIADLFATAMQSSVDNNSFTDNSTTYTAAGGNVVGFSFIVPSSGMVSFAYGGWLSVSVTGNGVLVSIQIRTGLSVGAGSIVIAASDDNCVQVVNTAGNPDRQGVEYLFEGTPGDVYNVQLLHRVTGSVGTYNRRFIVSHPK